MVTVGEICLKVSLLSSTSWYISSSDTVREEPRPAMVTVRESVPMSAKLSSMYPCMPLPMPTMTMTAHTPMMMPSMVRKVRILLLRIFWTAI